MRSDGMDKYAQADSRFIGKPGTPTGVTVEGPELTGATNVVLGALDHREVAFHPRAFRKMSPEFHCRPRAGAHRDCAGAERQVERPCDRYARRRV